MNQPLQEVEALLGSVQERAIEDEGRRLATREAAVGASIKGPAESNLPSEVSAANGKGDPDLRSGPPGRRPLIGQAAQGHRPMPQ